MNTIALGAGALTLAEMHHCHSFSRFSRPYRPVIIDMHSPRGSWRCSLCCWCVSLAFARVGQPIAWSLGTSDGASRSLGKMSSLSNSQIVLLGLMRGTQELAATSFLRVTLVPSSTWTSSSLLQTP